MTSAQIARLYWNESRFEFLKLLRMPSYSVSTILFPLMLYIFFGLMMPSRGSGGVQLSRYLLGTYGAFAVMGATLFAIGVGISAERGMGWLQAKRASPMPPLAYFVAKGVVALSFSAIVITLLFVLGATAGGVNMPWTAWLRLGGMLLLGSVPFGALGLAIGMLIGPNSAPMAVNILYLPMSFCSGLWIPLPMLPKYLQKAAPFLPAYHLGKLGLHSVGASVSGSVLSHCVALAAFAFVFLAIAWMGHAREQEKLYG